MIQYEFEPLLEYLKQTYDHDLTVYHHLTLNRQLRRRMTVLGIKTGENYLDYLKTYPEEFSFLSWNKILIKVTRFFRDRPAWDNLANEIVPQILANKQPNEPIRIWSAGCASGQEVYTLAIVLAEVLGIEQYLQRVKIYATDVSEQAIAIARKASYSISEVASVPVELLAKYFERVEERYVFDPTLSSKVILGHHNLTEDPPISKLDLLVCRNVLIYFNLQAQNQILVHFHFALNHKGFLFLGNAETLTTHKNIFTALGVKHRIFTKVLQLSLKDRMLLAPHHSDKGIDTSTSQISQLQTAVETSSVAQIALNLNNRAIAINQQAYLLLGWETNKVGCSLYQLKLYKILGLCAALRQVSGKRLFVTLKKVEWLKQNSSIYLDIQIAPILSASDRLLAISLTFTDVTGDWQLEEELKRANTKLDTIYLHLNHARQELAASDAALDLLNYEVIQ